jgi:hypothetical protein
MTDRPEETPAQRALRLKQAALQSRPRPPGGGIDRERNARMAAGASKPWMKR